MSAPLKPCYPSLYTFYFDFIRNHYIVWILPVGTLAALCLLFSFLMSAVDVMESKADDTIEGKTKQRKS